MYHESRRGRRVLLEVPREQFTKKNTLSNYEYLLSKFSAVFRNRELESIGSDEILSFLTELCDGNRQATKRGRYSSLSAFFSLLRNSFDLDLKNPCDTIVLRKLFRAPKYAHWEILDKETVDEIIFKIPKIRDRLLVELMARGGLRVS